VEIVVDEGLDDGFFEGVFEVDEVIGDADGLGNGTGV